MDPSQLNALSTIPFVRTSGVGRLRLGGDMVEHPERKRWESELNRYYFACGCDTGATGLILGLLAGIVWAAYSIIQGETGIGYAVGVVLLIAIAGAVAGKLIGLIQANNRLNRTVTEIQTHWQSSEIGENEQWSCG